MVEKRLKSGNYFKGVKKGDRVFYVLDYKSWFKQIMVWLAMVFLVGFVEEAKLLVVGVQIGLKGVIGEIGDKAVSVY